MDQTLIRQAPVHGCIQVRLTPADRERAAKVLRARLGSVYTITSRVTGKPVKIRSYSTHESVLLDCVRYGPRGWSVAMPPATAAEIAGKLTRSTAADIGRRFQAAARSG